MHQKVLRILKISAQAMKISNFEEEEIKVLSREEHKSFENICYICQENVKDKYDKIKSADKLGTVAIIQVNIRVLYIAYVIQSLV